MYLRQEHENHNLPGGWLYRLMHCAPAYEQVPTPDFSLAKLTYAGNMVNLTNVGDKEKYTFLMGDIVALVT